MKKLIVCLKIKNFNVQVVTGMMCQKVCFNVRIGIKERDLGKIPVQNPN